MAGWSRPRRAIEQRLEAELGVRLEQDEIAPEVYTPGRGGTLQSDIVAAARRHGRLAVPVDDLSGLVAMISAMYWFQRCSIGLFASASMV